MIRITLKSKPAPQADSSDDAYTIGEMDFDDGKPCEPLFYYCDLVCIEAYIISWKDAEAAARKSVA